MVCGLDQSRLPRSRPDLCAYGTAPRRDLVPLLRKNRPLGKPFSGDLKPDPSWTEALVIITIVITSILIDMGARNYLA
jgi:hypothetical protein